MAGGGGGGGGVGWGGLPMITAEKKGLKVERAD